MPQMLLYYEFKFEADISLNKILNTPDDSDIGYFLEVDLRYPDKIKKKQNIFHFAQKIKKLIPGNIMSI